MEEHFYKISEKDLIKLLKRDHILSCLEQGGVDNWSWYMYNRDEYLADFLNVTKDEVINDDLDFYNIALEELKKYSQI